MRILLYFVGVALLSTALAVTSYSPLNSGGIHLKMSKSLRNISQCKKYGLFGNHFFCNEACYQTWLKPDNHLFENNVRLLASVQNIAATTTANANMRHFEAPISPFATVYHESIAKVMGYMLGVGAIVMYIPIITHLLNSKSSEGLSATTWVLNLIGLMLTVSYTIKKGYGFNTFIDVVAALFQTIGVVGLIAYFDGYFLHFVSAMAIATLMFGAFLRNNSVSEQLMSYVQLLSTAVFATSNIPQIVLTFRQKKSSWSLTSAILSLLGCVMRVYTTRVLTDDSLVLIDYMIGTLTNFVLLSQILYYNYRQL